MERKTKDKKVHKKAKKAEELKRVEETEVMEEIIDLTKSDDSQVRLKAV